MSESVKVAVRVRPFNQREKDRSAKLIVTMPEDEPGKVVLRDPKSDPNNPKENVFTFDYAYWSHDKSRKFDTQDIVFQDMGADILTKSFLGFNFTLFAYGQTGAGKSYSMMGSGDINGSESGIIPRFCRDLFIKINENRADPNNTTEYQVQASFLEIYNEKIRDLLNPAQDPKVSLTIRESKEMGIHIPDIKKPAVGCYDDINRILEEGNKNRTIGATAMNAVSSRSHSVFTIYFVQKTKDPQTKKESTVISKVNLVDLAGSERAESTGATGDRLKEGCAINKSLSALGNVISALAKNSDPNLKKKVLVPYRDSVLTRLLTESLGGNSITTMIAAMSPADINYDETLSTLRYADRAKQIKNAAKRNESPTDKLIREMKEEIERLKQQLISGGITPLTGPPTGAAAGAAGAGGAAPSSAPVSGLSAAEKQEMLKEIEAKQKEIEEMNMSWEEKLKQALEEEKLRNEARMKSRISGSASTDGKVNDAMKHPHFTNLNEDPMMSETLIFDLRDSASFGKDSDQCDISFNGIGLREVHMKTYLVGKREIGRITDRVTGSEKVFNCDVYRMFVLNNAETYVNGEAFNDYLAKEKEKRLEDKANNKSENELIPIPGKEDLNSSILNDEDYIELKHGMRVILGSGTYLKFIDPDIELFLNEQAIANGNLYKPPILDYEYAKHEQAKKKMGLLDGEDTGNTDEEIEKRMKEIEDKYEKRFEEEIAAIKSGKSDKTLDQLKEERKKNHKAMRQETKRMQIESRDRRQLESSIIDLMEPINRSNFYMAVFEKGIMFEIEVKNKVENKFVDHVSVNVNLSTVCIRMTKSKGKKGGKPEYDTSFLTSEEFLALFARMEEIYEELLLMRDEGESNDKLREREEDYWGDDDPFTAKGPVLIGASCLLLLPLLYCLNDSIESPLISADDAKKIGDVVIRFGVTRKDKKPCEEDSLENGTEYDIFIEIVKASGIPRRLRKDVKVSFKFNGLQRTYICSDSDVGTNATASSVDIYYRAEIPIVMDDALREYLESGMLVVEIFGCPSNRTVGLKDTTIESKPKQVSIEDLKPLEPISTKSSQSNGLGGSLGSVAADINNISPIAPVTQKYDSNADLNLKKASKKDEAKTEKKEKKSKEKKPKEKSKKSKSKSDKKPKK